MSTYQATQPPDGSTCDTRACQYAAEVGTVILARPGVAAPDHWDTCAHHWPGFRAACLRGGHEITDTTARGTSTDHLAGWHVSTDGDGRLHATRGCVTVHAWLTGPLLAQIQEHRQRAGA